MPTPYVRSLLPTIQQELKRKRVPTHGRVAKSLIAAILVENPQGVRGGDRDSEGPLQQRPSQGWGPASESDATDIAQYLNRAINANRGFRGSAGQLAQSIQRSAFPERYDQQSAQAEALMRRIQGSSQAPGVSLRNDVASTSGGVPGASQDTSQEPTVFDVIRRYRDATQGTPQKSSSLNSPYDPQKSAQQIQATVSKIKAARAAMQTGDATAVGANRDKDVPVAVAQMIEEADKIDQAKLPYLWGGGHTAKSTRGAKLSPLDCSGAVSRVLGIDPRVSGALAQWGEAGRGKHVTIYANAEHTLMEINGHFFGTSSSNPGGGAGWIPRKFVSKEYLSKFEARHPKGL